VIVFFLCSCSPAGGIKEDKVRYNRKIRVRRLMRQISINLPSKFAPVKRWFDPMSKDELRRKREKLLREASNGNLEAVKNLVESGVSVNTKDSDGETALMSAVDSDSVETVKYLLEHGAKVNHRDRDGLTPFLCLKSGSKCAEILIAHGANINHADKDGMTPLKYAVYDGDIERVGLLLESGAKLDKRKGFEWFSLFFALFPGYGQDFNKAFQILDKGFDADLVPANRGRWTALIWAVRLNHTDIAKLLIESGADVNIKYGYYRWTALYWAALQGQTEVVELLLEHGADVNAAIRGQKYTALSEAVKRGYTDIVKIIVENGARIEARTKREYTPLMYAVEEGHVDIVRILLKSGADTTVRFIDGMTVLHKAAEKGDITMMKLLLDYGADAGAVDANGNTVLSLTITHAPADDKTEIIHMLQESGAVANEMKTDVSSLISAVQKGDMELVKLLLEKGADINGMGKGKQRPLNHAPDREMAAFLVDNGARINVQEGESPPLLDAAWGGVPM
jgi:ankyrin repeat protein